MSKIRLIINAAGAGVGGSQRAKMQLEGRKLERVAVADEWRAHVEGPSDTRTATAQAA